MMKSHRLQEITIPHQGSGYKPDPSLERILQRIRIRAKRRIQWLRKLWNEEGESGGKLAVTHNEINTYLEDRDSPGAETAWFASDESISSLNRELAALEAVVEADKESRFARLIAMFGLEKAETDLLQTCLAVKLDPAMSRVYAYLHDHAGWGYPTAQLAARLFGHGRSIPLNPGSTPARWELVIEKETGPGEPNQLTCDNLIAQWLQGKDTLDESLVGIAAVCEPTTPLEAWPVKETAAFIKNRLKKENSCKLRIRIAGPPGSGRRTLAAIIASKIGLMVSPDTGLSLLSIDSDQVDDPNWNRVFLRAQRQAYLGNYALAWYGEKVMQRKWPRLEMFSNVQFVICEPGQAPLPLPGIIEHLVEMPVPTLQERKKLWKQFVPVSNVWPGEKLDELVTQHRTNIGDIISVSKGGVDQVEEAINLVCRKARHRLADFAQLMECPFTKKDLVITESLSNEIENVIFEAKEREAFWENREAKRLFPQGRGLLALFSGTPGTGKTMAAQVIAAGLGIDLFRCNLARIVSKYVGETSKNLDRILTRAAGMGIVLLFDEADALFGKRTEIKDAHDRFANTDTGYLLQAIENYQGVALLATNKKANIDPAFIRRIRYVLEFPKPDARQREEIWRRIVCGLAGTESMEPITCELKALASDLELTGAQIKFAVLSAVFVARREGEGLSMSHLLQGVDRELMKQGRALSSRERERLDRRMRSAE
ncbi:MAG: AAA family ATPase [bacterium]|nr:AAA family ATPase [bacterium]